MKLDDNVIDILKNFALINPSIIVKEGNTLETISPSKTIIAKAIVPVVFNQKFAIYNLHRFINAIHLFKNPDFLFKENCVTIQEDSKSVVYTYAEERILLKNKVPDQLPDVTDVKATFNINTSILEEIKNVIKILGIQNFIMEGDGTNIAIKVQDIKNPTSDGYSLIVGQSQNIFKAIIETKGLDLIEDDYKVEICSSGIVKFSGNKVMYIIACHYDSDF